MNKSSRTRIDQFITDAVAPTRLKGSEAMALKANKSIIKLVDDTGASTTAGRYWAKKTGSELPVGGFMAQVAERTGNVESIRLRDGARGVTRRWDEATGEYNFTRLGNQYYKTLRRNYI